MAPLESRLERHRKKNKSSFDWLIVLLFALIASLCIRIFIYEPFDVIGSSMKPTLQSGDLVMVNKWKYRLREPERGEIVVFHASEERDYIKRVVALPGDTVEVKQHQLWVNGKRMDESYLPASVQTTDFPSQTVPEKHLFVMGDNRENSRDSRSDELGPIKQSEMIGKVELIYWPITDWRILK